MEEKVINAKDSLDLIARMISNTQRKIEKVHALPFLIFGYLTVVVSLVVWYLLWQTHNYLWNFLWMSIPVFGIPILFLLKRKEPMVRTFVDKAIDYVWMVCSGTVVIASFIPTLWKHVPILFVVALLINMGTMLTGLISRVRLLAVAGGIGILSALVLPSFRGLDAILFFAAIFVVTMIIPGHILGYKGRKNEI